MIIFVFSNFLKNIFMGGKKYSQFLSDLFIRFALARGVFSTHAQRLLFVVGNNRL